MLYPFSTGKISREIRSVITNITEEDSKMMLKSDLLQTGLMHSY